VGALEAGRGELRLAELIALLSLGTDLGLGQPMEHMIRACLIALRLADYFDLDSRGRAVVYYSGLLAWVGCHTDAYEQAKWFGDDLHVKSDAHYVYDFGRPSRVAAFMLSNVGGAGQPVLERARVGAAFLGDGIRSLQSLAENHYRATDELADRLGLGMDVRESLRQSYERWDGKGPYGLKADAICLSSRLMTFADVIEVFHRTHGLDAALAVAKERKGTQFDPMLVERFTQEADVVLGDLDAGSSWDDIVSAEPVLGRVLAGVELDAALAALGEFAELKSPWTIGHAHGVAELVTEAARLTGMPPGEVLMLQRAAYVHDLGRLGVSNAIWDKPGPLSLVEFERVRLHPYLSERMLAFSPVLAPLAAIAVQHHERLDGSGYPRGLSGTAISPAGRLLGAADLYHALAEFRPHRPPLRPEECAAVLRAEVAAGRVDADAADAVLQAAGHRVTRRPEAGSSGLTQRELQVLRLLARGLSTKAIAENLVISRKTAGTHIEHIYAKTGASNRAQASLYALKHGLITDIGA
jgi:HD-GYP domain-containing protein (c-di-GMP phosphodiesterase class II)